MNQFNARRIPGLFAAVLLLLGLGFTLVPGSVAWVSDIRPSDGFNHTATDHKIIEEINRPHQSISAAWSPFRHPRKVLYSDMARDNPVFQKEFRCLAQAVYFEARSEPVEGQIAVAQVVLNRVRSIHYPNSICGVVFQGEYHRNRCQFSFACDGLSDNPHNPVAWNEARNIAEQALTHQQDDLTLNATHYHADYVDPRWAATLQKTIRVGKHVFYRNI